MQPRFLYWLQGGAIKRRDFASHFKKLQLLNHPPRGCATASDSFLWAITQGNKSSQQLKPVLFKRFHNIIIYLLKIYFWFSFKNCKISYSKTSLFRMVLGNKINNSNLLVVLRILIRTQFFIFFFNYLYFLNFLFVN